MEIRKVFLKDNIGYAKGQFNKKLQPNGIIREYYSIGGNKFCVYEG